MSARCRRAQQSTSASIAAAIARPTPLGVRASPPETLQPPIASPGVAPGVPPGPPRRRPWRSNRRRGRRPPPPSARGTRPIPDAPYRPPRRPPIPSRRRTRSRRLIPSCPPTSAAARARRAAGARGTRRSVVGDHVQVAGGAALRGVPPARPILLDDRDLRARIIDDVDDRDVTRDCIGAARTGREHDEIAVDRHRGLNDAARGRRLGVAPRAGVAARQPGGDVPAKVQVAVRQLGALVAAAPLRADPVRAQRGRAACRRRCWSRSTRSRNPGTARRRECRRRSGWRGRPRRRRSGRTSRPRPRSDRRRTPRRSPPRSPAGFAKTVPRPHYGAVSAVGRSKEIRAGPGSQCAWGAGALCSPRTIAGGLGTL